MIAPCAILASYLGRAGEFFGEIADSSQNLWESSHISGRPKTGDCGRRIRMPDPTRDRRQHKRQVLKMNHASWNVAHVAAYEFFGCVARARGPAAGGLRMPALPAGPGDPTFDLHTEPAASATRAVS